MTEINEKLLDERLGALELARTWSPRVVSKLESHIRSADDARSFASIRSALRARRRHSGGRGDRSLPACRVARPLRDGLDPALPDLLLRHRELPGVQNCLNSHCHCSNCSIDIVAALDDMIAVTFTVSPAIRRIAYHDPEQLSVEDYFSPLPRRGGRPHPRRHALPQSEGSAEQGDGVHRARRDGHNRGRRGAGCAARSKRRRRRRPSCSSSTQRFQPPSSGSISAATRTFLRAGRRHCRARQDHI